MEHWDVVHELLIAQGIPEPLLGFFCITREEAVAIAGLLSEREPHALLEIGAFVGLSTGVLALASPMDSSLIVIDPDFPIAVQAHRFGYSGYVDPRNSLTIVRGVLDHFVPQKPIIVLPGFYSGRSDRFASRYLEPLGIVATQTPVVGGEASKFGPYDFVFLDGDHYAEAVCADLSAIHHDLSDSGVIVLHDVTGGWQAEVLEGVGRFLHEQPQYTLAIEGTLGILTNSVRS